MASTNYGLMHSFIAQSLEHLVSTDSILLKWVPFYHRYVELAVSCLTIHWAVRTRGRSWVAATYSPMLAIEALRTAVLMGIELRVVEEGSRECMAMVVVYSCLAVMWWAVDVRRKLQTVSAMWDASTQTPRRSRRNGAAGRGRNGESVLVRLAR